MLGVHNSHSIFGFFLRGHIGGGKNCLFYTFSVGDLLLLTGEDTALQKILPKLLDKSPKEQIRGKVSIPSRNTW